MTSNGHKRSDQTHHSPHSSLYPPPPPSHARPCLFPRSRNYLAFSYSSTMHSAGEDNETLPRRQNSTPGSLYVGARGQGGSWLGRMAGGSWPPPRRPPDSATDRLHAGAPPGHDVGARSGCDAGSCTGARLLGTVGLGLLLAFWPPLLPHLASCATSCSPAAATRYGLRSLAARVVTLMRRLSSLTPEIEIWVYVNSCSPLPISLLSTRISHSLWWRHDPVRRNAVRDGGSPLPPALPQPGLPIACRASVAGFAPSCEATPHFKAAPPSRCSALACACACPSSDLGTNRFVFCSYLLGLIFFRSVLWFPFVFFCECL